MELRTVLHFTKHTGTLSSIPEVRAERVHFETWGQLRSSECSSLSGFLALLPVSPKYQTIFCGSWTRASLSLACWAPCGSSAGLAPTICLPLQPPSTWRPLVEGQARCRDSSGVTCRPLSAMLPRGSWPSRPLRWQLEVEGAHL